MTVTEKLELDENKYFELCYKTIRILHDGGTIETVTKKIIVESGMPDSEELRSLVACMLKMVDIAGMGDIPD